MLLTVIVFVTFVLCEAGPPLPPTTHTVLTKLVSLCDHPNDEVILGVAVDVYMYVYMYVCMCVVCMFLCVLCVCFLCCFLCLICVFVNVCLQHAYVWG